MFGGGRRLGIADRFDDGLVGSSGVKLGGPISATMDGPSFCSDLFSKPVGEGGTLALGGFGGGTFLVAVDLGRVFGNAFSLSCGSKLSNLGGSVGEGFGETPLGAIGGFGLESFTGFGEEGGFGAGLRGTGPGGFCKCAESILPLIAGGSSKIFSLIGFLAIGGGVVSLCESSRFLTHAGASSENEPLLERTHGATLSSSLSSTLALLMLSAGLRLFNWPAHGGGAWPSVLLSSFLFLFSKASKSICPLFFKASC